MRRWLWKGHVERVEDGSNTEIINVNILLKGTTLAENGQRFSPGSILSEESLHCSEGTHIFICPHLEERGGT